MIIDYLDGIADLTERISETVAALDVKINQQPAQLRILKDVTALSIQVNCLITDLMEQHNAKAR